MGKPEQSKLGDTDRSKYSGLSGLPLKRSATRKFKNKGAKTTGRNQPQGSAPSSSVSAKRGSTTVTQDDFTLKKALDLFGKLATKEDTSGGPSKKVSKRTSRSIYDRDTVVPYPVEADME